ncbi:MAG: hypothetical protein HRU32_12330, partial [Rhodobacteraceae bacterium]|nr:hypothetical protein [Paracoccaceae bacterium]
MNFLRMAGLACVFAVGATAATAATIKNGTLDFAVDYGNSPETCRRANDAIPYDPDEGGWLSGNGTPDVNDVNNNYGGVQALPILPASQRTSANPNGCALIKFDYVAQPPVGSQNDNTWVGLIAANDPALVGGGVTLAESIFQTVTDLTVGQEYTIWWHAANFGISFESLDEYGYNLRDVDDVGVVYLKINDEMPDWVNWEEYILSVGEGFEVQ